MVGVGMVRIQIVIGTIYPKCLEGADVLFRLNQVVERKRARPRHVKSVVKLPSLYERGQEDVHVRAGRDGRRAHLPVRYEYVKQL